MEEIESCQLFPYIEWLYGLYTQKRDVMFGRFFLLLHVCRSVPRFLCLVTIQSHALTNTRTPRYAYQGSKLKISTPYIKSEAYNNDRLATEYLKIMYSFWSILAIHLSIGIMHGCFLAIGPIKYFVGPECAANTWS